MDNFGMDEFKELEDLKKMIDNLNAQFGPPPQEKQQEEIRQVMEGFDMVKRDWTIDTKYVNSADLPDPEYAKKGDSGFDLRANIDTPITLNSLERELIPTGLYVELPENTELQVRPRSGLALKHGITVLNTPGTVDEGYRGEIGVILVNLSKDKYTINPGDKIAQGVIMNVLNQNISKLIKTKKLSETERSTGGFGSTGK